MSPMQYFSSRQLNNATVIANGLNTIVLTGWLNLRS